MAKAWKEKEYWAKPQKDWIKQGKERRNYKGFRATNSTAVHFISNSGSLNSSKYNKSSNSSKSSLNFSNRSKGRITNYHYRSTTKPLRPIKKRTLPKYNNVIMREVIHNHLNRQTGITKSNLINSLLAISKESPNKKRS